MSFGLIHAQAVLRRKLGPLPDGWEVYKIEAIGPDAAIFTGGVPRIVERGLRKREKTWRGVLPLKAVVTKAEEKEESDRYEHETGNCGRCLGTGEIVAGWHHIDGTRMRPCPRCGGTRKAVMEGNDGQA